MKARGAGILKSLSQSWLRIPKSEIMPPVPDWNSIKDFTTDLLHIHDQEDIPEEFKVKLARSIATLRDDKQTEVIADNQKEFRKIIMRPGL